MSLHILEARHTRATRHTCTREDPYRPSRHIYANHPDARPLPQPKPGSVWCRCPHCGVKFQVIAFEKK
jgi:hypothetical protein